MKRAALLLLGAALVALWAACDSEPPTGVREVEAAYEIWDAVHNNGVPHFFWLPPMVENPNPTGTFLGTLDPTVLICKGWGLWPDPEPNAPPPCTPGSQGLELLQKYTRYLGPGDERVVVVNGQHYQLNWDTKSLPETDLPEHQYRIAVWVGGAVLGHADVYVDRNAKSFTHDEMTVELIDGSTLPIKFRIEDEWFEVAFHGPGNDFDVLLSTPPYGPGVHFANVTDSPGLDGGPAWSPDGRQMAFFSNREGTNKLFVMNWDGTGIRLVPTGVLGPYPAPAWSPDGQWIAYQGVSHGPAPDPDWDIYMVPASGGGTPTRLTFPDGDGSGGFIKYEEWEPTWHPDGDRITFAKSHDDPVDCPPAADVCDFDIVSVYWATGVEVNHTNNRDLDQDSPAWSPDGKYLIYSAEKKDEVSADPDNPRKYLWAIGMGGEDGNVPIAGPYQLTADDSGTNAEDQEASFSHDGRWILFTRAQDGPPFVLYWGNWEDWVNQKTLNYHFFTDGGGAQWRPSTR